MRGLPHRLKSSICWHLRDLCTNPLSNACRNAIDGRLSLDTFLLPVDENRHVFTPMSFLLRLFRGSQLLLCHPVRPRQFPSVASTYSHCVFRLSYSHILSLVTSHPILQLCSFSIKCIKHGVPNTTGHRRREATGVGSGKKTPVKKQVD